MIKKRPFLNPWTTAISIAVILLVGLALGGNAFNWTWTGFVGNTFWDWLNLLLLPLMLTGITIWLSERPNWTSRHTMLLTGGLIIFVILIIGGYTFNWKWTGFRGNTLWDWLKLLVLPVALTLATVRFTTTNPPQYQADSDGTRKTRKRVGSRPLT